MTKAVLGFDAHAMKPGPLKRFVWLLKRELWEHKTSLVWAPVFIGALLILLVLLTQMISVSDANIVVNGAPLARLAGSGPPQRFALGLALGFSLWLFFVPAILMFFYCLSTLYDERADRSVLFWKSLPTSDALSVGSKAVTALVVAPLVTAMVVLGVILAIVCIRFFVMTVFDAQSVAASLPPGLVVLSLAQAVLLIPLHVIWALPCVGWLLMVSAWARSKPLLWAVGLPVVFFGLLAMFDQMARLNLPMDWFWRHIVLRVLLSIFPSSWFQLAAWPDGVSVTGPHGVANLAADSLPLLATADLWIGAAAGIAMIAIAIRLRRWREAD